RMQDDQAFETINADGRAPILLLCDHASNAVPASVAGGSLGLPETEMRRHIAYDIGARGVTLALTGMLDAPAVLSQFSGRVIEPNGGVGDPALVMRLYDGTIAPATRHLDAAAKRRRPLAWHRPYRAGIYARIDAMLARGQVPVLISVHS